MTAEDISPLSLGRRGSSRALVYMLERELPTLIVGVAFACVVAAALSRTLNQDGWLALVGGREVVHHGLPSIDRLTFWSAGRRWTDQQWLGQLGLYGLEVMGGIRAVLAAHWLIVSSTFAILLLAARRLGGSPTSTAVVAAGAFIPLLGTISEVRTEAAGGLLFILTLWLLIAELRAPTWRLYLVLPLLVVWANVHGSVLLGAGLCVVAGAAFTVEQLRLPRADRLRHRHRRAATLLLGPVACVFASPYAFSLSDYYRRTLFNHDFGKFVTEWQPTTFSLANLPVFVLVGGGIWLLSRSGSATSPFERIAFLLTAVAAFTAVRNIGWLAIVSVMVLPRTFGRARPVRTADRVPAVAVGLMLAAAGGLVFSLVAVGRAPGSQLAARYPDRAAAVVARALERDPSARIFANEQFADWLLWRLPAARGRVGFDARFELLTSGELRRVSRWTMQSTDRWRGAAAGTAIAVIPTNQTMTAALRRSGARLAYANSEATVFLLPAGFGRRPGP